MNRRTKRRLVQSLREAEGLCLHCGYNLTGNVSGVCPECGKEIKQPIPGTAHRRKPADTSGRGSGLWP